MIVNVLIASLFPCKMIALPSMPQSIYKVVKQDIVHFLWKGAKPKVAYDYLVMTKDEGGAGLVDLIARDKAIKIT